MARYIDADKIISHLNDEIEECGDAIVSLRDVRKAIAQAESADVQAVRHGKWIEDKETGSLICSECCHFTDEIIGDMIEADEDISLALEIPLKTIIHRSMNPIYCSKCGAKMDGKE